MARVVCPTCFHSFRTGQLAAVITCPKCGLSLSCEANSVPETNPTPSTQGKTQPPSAKGKPQLSNELWAAIIVGIVPLTIVFIVLTLVLVMFTKVTDSRSSRSAATPIVPLESKSLTRDQHIDAWVDQQVEKHWRPLPGGNSKEDAKRVTREIMKARNWEEYERVAEQLEREGL